LDEVEFGFAPNVGEPMRPLRQIASSGEISRVMLALKAVLARYDRIPVLVFDEIDANIGGETGVAVGRKLREVSTFHQLICITHLPQVAACGHVHWAVQKEAVGGRTFTRVHLLDEEGRVDELARMLGGQSDATRHHAADLLNAAHTAEAGV
jgi:DNA repair protein RecN (Recombination protein N)